MKYATFFVTLIVALGLSACAGPQGATGATGATGVRGAPGYQGPAGPMGNTGQTGQASTETIIVPAAHTNTDGYWFDNKYYYYSR